MHRSRALKWGTSICLMMLLCAPQTAQAYTLVKRPWRLPIAWSLGTTSADLSAEGSERIVIQALTDWTSVPCARVETDFLGTTDQPPGEEDGENVIGWADDWRFGRHVIGRTIFRSSRETTEADIVFNAEHFEWVEGLPETDLEVDAYSIVLHELGHLFGIGHSDVEGAAMQAGYDHTEYSLSDDDRVAICTLYPRNPIAVRVIGRGETSEPPFSGPEPSTPEQGGQDRTAQDRSSRALGEACETNQDCAAGGCAESGGRMFCTQRCTEPRDCGAGFACEPRGDFQICVPREGAMSSAASSCAIMPGRKPAGAWWLPEATLLLGLTVWWPTMRRSRRRTRLRRCTPQPNQRRR